MHCIMLSENHNVAQEFGFKECVEGFTRGCSAPKSEKATMKVQPNLHTAYTDSMLTIHFCWELSGTLILYAASFVDGF
jgi:hypothetical protein